MRRHFVRAHPPTNQNLNDQRGFSSLFAVALQGLSKNGRGSCGAGGEVAPVDAAKWRVFKGFPKMWEVYLLRSYVTEGD